MSDLTLIAVDLMDTLVVDPFFRIVPKLTSQPIAELAAHVDPQVWPDFERGLIDEATFHQRFYRPSAGKSGLPSAAALPSTHALRDAIFADYHFVEGMETLLSDLRETPYSLWLLSNYPRWFEVVRDALDLDRFFDGYVVSYQTGARKPEAAAFMALCAQSGVLPPECLLIDDREANVSAAAALGMRVHHFSTAETLRTELTRARIL